MGEVVAAAVYARISADHDGTALGVKRQVADCRRVAEELGWAVAEEYIDNDLSAFSGKRRPGYERMLADIADGARDAVLVYHADRLTRRPIELEQFLEVITAAGVRHVRFVAGAPVDVANGDGLMVLRLLAAVAANESASKSRRVRRKMVEVAESGRPHGGSQRPFGYGDDLVTVRPDEAEIIRVVVARYLAGEGLNSLAAWLDAEGVPTVNGKPWRTTTLRTILRSGRIAGLREHQGRVVGPAVWPAIITEADRARILARMSERAATNKRTPRRYLLSGLLRCGRCDNRLFSQARETTRRYVCTSGPDHGGCGRISVVAAPVEELVAAAVLYRLDTPQLADALTGRAVDDEQAAALAEAVAADRAQLEELAALYADKTVTAREWMAARSRIETRIHDAERRLARLTRNDALAGLVGNGEQLRGQWNALNLTRQHAIVAAVLDHARIRPSTTPGIRTLDPTRVDLVWRL
jgi:DNA invertase Pin-like site-specific DNA recombinase